ncbi:MAG: hypothetical protein KAJ42_12255 [Gemmatimonadetes bacterium]|nr:hypothetical protein [Gemmatimonadota bacterium]
MLGVAIRDALSKRAAGVDIFGALRTRDTGLPPFGNTVQAIPFQAFFSDVDGVTDMRVDGSVDPVFFEIRPDTDRDRYIKTVQFSIVDAQATLNRFGFITALTNGTLFEWDRLGETVELAVMQTNYDHVRLSGGDPAMGTAAGTFQAPNVISTSEAYIPLLDFQKIFGLPWGIRLAAGSDEVLRLTIRDDTQAVDGYDALARGFEIEPEEAQAGLGT